MSDCHVLLWPKLHQDIKAIFLTVCQNIFFLRFSAKMSHSYYYSPFFCFSQKRRATQSTIQKVQRESSPVTQKRWLAVTCHCGSSSWNLSVYNQCDSTHRSSIGMMCEKTPPLLRQPCCSVCIDIQSWTKLKLQRICYGNLFKKETSCNVSLCVSGTPVSDTVCKRCPAGHFSTSDSSAEPCQPHQNCSHLGLKTLKWGSATSDSLCAPQDKTATLDCSQHQALCHNGKRPHCKVLVQGCPRPCGTGTITLTSWIKAQTKKAKTCGLRPRKAQGFSCMRKV